MTYLSRRVVSPKIIHGVHTPSLDLAGTWTIVDMFQPAGHHIKFSVDKQVDMARDASLFDDSANGEREDGPGELFTNPDFRARSSRASRESTNNMLGVLW